MRGKIKAIEAAQETGGRTEDELAAATGLPIGKIREAQAAEAARPSSMDDYLDHEAYGGLADDGHEADVEGQAEMHQTLQAVTAAFDALPPVQRVLVAMTFHREIPLAEAAQAVHPERAEARRLLDEALVTIHAALLAASRARAPGHAGRAPPQVVHVRTADTCRAADSAAVPDGKFCNRCGQDRPLGEFGWWNRPRRIRSPYCRPPPWPPRPAWPSRCATTRRGPPNKTGSSTSCSASSP